MTTRYPSSLDGVDNLPTVKNTVTDIDSAYTNSIRDAILSIEKTLGVNPNGTYTSLASRLSIFINDDGSLKKSAFIAIGGIFGPIVNSDIDANAAIDESKLHLAYPTELLQEEVKTVEARQAGIINLLKNLNTDLLNHIASSAAHDANHIVVSAFSSSPSSAATMSVAARTNVQSVIEELYNSHINFLPSGLLPTSSTNRAHAADQIYYNNTDTQLSASSVQSAIDAVVNNNISGINDHQRQLHSNGILGKVAKTDPTNATVFPRGKVIFENQAVIVDYPTATSSTDNDIYIRLDVPKNLTYTGAYGETINYNLAPGQDVTIKDSSYNIFGVVKITSLKISSNTLVGLRVFYDPSIFNNSTNLFFKTGSATAGFITISEKVDSIENQNALNSLARTFTAGDWASAIDQIQVALPNAPTVITNGFNPYELGHNATGGVDLSATNKIRLIINEDTSLSYLVTVIPTGGEDITQDTVIAAMNYDFFTGGYPFTAFKLGKEIAIQLLYPEDSALGLGASFRVSNYGLTTQDATSAMGLGGYLQTKIAGSYSETAEINGTKFSTLRQKFQLIGSGFTLTAGSTDISIPLSTSLKVYGIRKGDFVILRDVGANSGIRKVLSVGDDTLTVNLPNFSSVTLSSTSSLTIYSCGLTLTNLATRIADEVPTLPAENAVVQIYATQNGDIDFSVRALYSSTPVAKGSAPTVDFVTPSLSNDGAGIVVTDVSRGAYGQPTGYKRAISFTVTSDSKIFATYGCITGGGDLDTKLHGLTVEISGDGSYELKDETGLNFITIDTNKCYVLFSSLPSAGTTYNYVLPIYFFDNINEANVLLLSNLYYNLSYNTTTFMHGELLLRDKRYHGNIGVEQVREDVIEKYVEARHRETRGNGVVSGLTVPSDSDGSLGILTAAHAYVNGGVVYISGIRYEIPSQDVYVDPSTLDITDYASSGFLKYYIFIDSLGRLQTSYHLILPNQQPWVPIAKVMLHSTGGDGFGGWVIDEAFAVDFRLFISDIDDKIELTVSPIEQQSAHFRTISAALEYVDAVRTNDLADGYGFHIRPTVIRLMEGSYQEKTTITIPPFVTLRGDNARNVRILAPNVRDPNGTAYKYDTIFNVTALPNGVATYIEKVCFDCTTLVKETTVINIRYFYNGNDAVPADMLRYPSLIEIKDCLFILNNATYGSYGIKTTFGVAVPVVVGGLLQYASNRLSGFAPIYLSEYYNYTLQSSVTASVPSAPVCFSSRTPGQFYPSYAENPDGYGPQACSSAAFSAGQYDGGGIIKIKNNTFLLGDKTLYCVDRFYDTSGNTLPVSTTRLDSFVIDTNIFKYSGYLNSSSIDGKEIYYNHTSLPAGSLVFNYVRSDFPAGTIPDEVDVTSSAARELIYDRMVHRDLRGFNPVSYVNEVSGKQKLEYPDPIHNFGNGNELGILDGYFIPAASNTYYENMIIANNVPTGLNIAAPNAVRMATDCLESTSRFTSGGGTIFATTYLYGKNFEGGSGMPVILDRSIDWHDRYIYIYANNADFVKKNTYTTPDMNNSIPTELGELNTGFGVWAGNSSTNAATVTSPDLDYAVAGTYGHNYPTAHAFTFGYGAPLSGRDVAVHFLHYPLTIKDWTKIRFIGHMNLSASQGNGATVTYTDTVAIVIMPNGNLAAFHTGTQGIGQSPTNLVEVATQVAPGLKGASVDTTRSSAQNLYVSFVITYSPKLNLLKPMDYTINPGIEDKTKP